MGAMGSDLAIQSADVALMSDNLMNIPLSIILARKTRSIIYQNLVLSLCISFLMILLSTFGIISVLAGSILHNVGAFVVILNSSRILKLNQLKL
jgi:Cd2+/Zn2+-exporting ATPase/Cu+-exporting ATPase